MKGWQEDVGPEGQGEVAAHARGWVGLAMLPRESSEERLLSKLARLPNEKYIEFNPFVPTVAFSRLSSNMCCWKPCWVGDSGMCGVIRFSMSRSMTLKAVLSSVMGLYEVTSVGNGSVSPCV